MELYGIIYADLAHSSKGSWGGKSYSYEAGTDFKNYYVSGRYEEGPFPANDILTAEGGENERFLIMALEDIGSYTWYKSKSSDGITVSTSTGIGSELVGKANTATMREIWEADTAVPENNNDIWGQIEENSNWFVPSKDEWLAFSDEFDIDLNNYSTTYGLGGSYWLSSQGGPYIAWYVNNYSGSVYNYGIGYNFCVRLSAAF